MTLNNRACTHGKAMMALMAMAACTLQAQAQRTKHNFNADWQLRIGDTDPKKGDGWEAVTLPRAFNGHEAFKRDIVDHTDTICWYRKTFTLGDVNSKKVFVEFEGFRMLGEVTVNGKLVGISENGVMASGFDITPFVRKGKNEILVRTDNSWQYRSREHNSRYQWNDRNFNANYGGIPKNVYIHETERVYQTLPLYSSLGTTGTYIYGEDYDIAKRQATVHAESQVRNEDTQTHTLTLKAEVRDLDGKVVGTFTGAPKPVRAGETLTLKAEKRLSGLHFWSWGYGYLYTVQTTLIDEDGREFDPVTTRTGFRKAEYHSGTTWLNDRALMMHGYAQRTSNEWPGLGLSVPAWLSDYSNELQVKSGGNLVRWMHVTPWKQDVESCDRVGLIQAMPAGDAERDVEGPRWRQRVELMRDAIVYMRNNPSILFYEGGNHGISEEHMAELKAIRDEFDPHGGRAIGSREMLDSKIAEYGGEMLYINKSGNMPMWAMEYCRDEAPRKYWDVYSYPYHKEGDGPLFRGNRSIAYNHNQDEFAVEMVRRWYDYWLERPGTGKRVSNGGVKIIFSDSNTHHRGEANYRTSGVTDAMRIEKDAFYAHQVMWSGWVDDEKQQTHIVGHWNYDQGVRKPVYVVSTADSVALMLNGKVLPAAKRDYNYLYTFDNVAYEPGTLTAVGYTNGRETSRHELQTVGKPHHLKLTAIENPEGFKADGADVALVQVEVVDEQGRRCPLANDMIRFELDGEGEWIGGLALQASAERKEADKSQKAENKGVKKGDGDDLLDGADTETTATNYVGDKVLPVECGVNRILVRSTTKAGGIKVRATVEGATGMASCDATLTLNTQAVDIANHMPQLTLRPSLLRGETPATPSYKDVYKTVEVAKVEAGSSEANAGNAIDDNERTEWRSNGKKEDSWIKFTLKEPATVSEVVLKLAGWRLKCYPLAVYADDTLIWQGITPVSLGYVHLPMDKAVEAKTITIRQLAPTTENDKFGEVKELAAKYTNTMEWASRDDGKTDMRVVEVDLLTK